MVHFTPIVRCHVLSSALGRPSSLDRLRGSSPRVEAHRRERMAHMLFFFCFCCSAAPWRRGVPHRMCGASGESSASHLATPSASHPSEPLLGPIHGRDWIESQGLAKTQPLTDLRGLRVGIDGHKWLSTLNHGAGITEPFVSRPLSCAGPRPDRVDPNPNPNPAR